MMRYKVGVRVERTVEVLDIDQNYFNEGASDPKTKNKDKNKIGAEKMLSLEYRKTSFGLSLIGSDSVVLAYNDLMQ